MKLTRPHILLRVTAVAVLLGGCVASQPPQVAIKEWKGHMTAPTGTSPTTRAVDRSHIPPLTDRLLPPFKNQYSAGKHKETFSVVVRDAPVNELLFALARDGELDLTLHPDIKGKVTLKVTNRPLVGILDAVAEQVPLRYEIEGSRVSVLPDAPYWRTYRIDYVNIARSTSSTSITGSSTGTLGGSSGGSSSGSSGGGGNGGASGGSSSGGANTTLNEQSTNLFWGSLAANLDAIMKTVEPTTSVSSSGGSSGGGTSGTVSSSSSGGGSAGGGSASSGGGASAGAGGAGGTASTGSSGSGASSSAGDSRIIINRETGIISIYAKRTTHGQLSRFIGEILQSARRQVLIEATIVEVVLSDDFETGIDWSVVRTNLTNTPTTQNSRLSANSGGAPTVSDGGVTTMASTALLAGAGITPFFSIGYSLFKSRFGSLVAAARMLDQFGQSRILSSPRIMVMNNQVAAIKVVDNQVYFTLEVKTSEATATASATTTVTSKMNNQPTGFTMLVTPFITEAGNVTLNVRPTLSRITEWKEDPSFAVAAAAAGASALTSSVPVVEVREMESMLRVQSGDIAILGGLIVDTQSSDQRGVPGLKDVAAIGRAFRQDAKRTRKTELVIFLRPVIGGNVPVGDHIAQRSTP